MIKEIICFAINICFDNKDSESKLIQSFKLIPSEQNQAIYNLWFYSKWHPAFEEGKRNPKTKLKRKLFFQGWPLLYIIKYMP